MYSVTVFETAEEFFKACSRFRAEEDDSPSIPFSVYVVFDGENVRLSGDGSERFRLAPGVSQADMIEAAFRLADTKVHIT